MERSHVTAFAYAFNHLLIDESAAEEFLTSVNHPVSDCFDVLEGIEDSDFLVKESLKHCLDSDGVVCNRHFALNFLLPGSLVLDTADFHSDTFHQAFGKEIIDIVVLHIQQLVLQRRTSTVKNKNYHNVKY